MCGVFGWILADGAHAAGTLEEARRATRSLSHRGPDHQGEWVERGVYMGHRRLSIVDLSAAANQPFQDRSGRHILSFNGEIYNFVELREELAARGHRFTTTSDTEVMLASLIEWGTDALPRLDGMFAGAWHDRRTGRHVVFRDALGQKPLYWCADDSGVIYASELRALLSIERRKWCIDRDRFARFLANSYYSGEDTPLTDVHKLLPGTMMTIEGGKPRFDRYWTNTPRPESDMTPSDAAALDALEEQLIVSCERSMRSDVPYGVFFSGGLDSSLILDCCHRVNPGVASFSVGMAEPDFDERDKAEVARRHIGVENHHVYMMDNDSVRDSVAAILEMCDEPHGDPGLVNAYMLSRAVRPTITVGISGDGGDELFAGYAPFTAIRPAALFDRLPLAAQLARLLVPLLPGSDKYLGLRFKAKAFLQGFPASDSLRLPLWLAALDLGALAALCSRTGDAFSSRAGAQGTLLSPYRALATDLPGGSAVQHFLHFYQRVFLPEFVCMHTDRASMLNSLEVRAPLLSPDMIRYANQLPDRMKLRGGTEKWLFRKLAERRGFPPAIAHQRKQGFTFPVARWLKGPLKGFLDETIDEEMCREDGLVDPAEVSRLYDDHMSGRENNYRILYNLMVFRAWRKKYPQVQSPAALA